MAKKRACRRTPKEIQDHDTAVKVRKMTDEQLCEFLREISRPKLTVEDFFVRLDKQAGSGSGISTGIIHKLRKIAVKEGFLEG